MNFSLHITASSGKSFDVYPNDSKREYLRHLSAGQESSRLAIWIEEGVIYYYSVLRLPGRYKFGILLGFKDMIITSPQMLLKLMSEMVAADMPREGSILRYADDGDIVLANKSLSDCTQAFDALHNAIDKQLTSNTRRLACRSEKIPSVIAPTESVEVGISTHFKDVREQINARHIVIMSTDSAFNADKTYAIISGMQAKLRAKDEELSVRAERIRKLEHSRKQYRFVLGLLGCLCIAGLGLYRLNSSLQLTEQSLDIANDTISLYSNRLGHAYNTIAENNRNLARQDSLIQMLEDKKLRLAKDKTSDSLRMRGIIESKDRDISLLEHDKRQVDTKLDNAQKELMNLNTKVSQMRSTVSQLRNMVKPYPFIATGFSKAGKTLYISYNAPDSKTGKIEIRCYNSKSIIAKSEYSFNVSEGTGKLSLGGVAGLDKAKYVVIYYNGLIIGGQWF